MKLIAAIYAAWIIATASLFMAGASSSIVASMVGAPIGWTLALLLVAGFYRLRGSR